MAVIITPQEDIKAYFESDAISQSKIKDLEWGLDDYLAKQAKKDRDEEEGIPKDYMLIGSAVDILLTGEEGAFHEEFHISGIEKLPSEIEMSLIQQVFDELVVNEVEQDTVLEDCDDMLKSAAIDQSWYGGKPGDKRINTLIVKATEYFEDLKKAKGKHVISTTQNILIVSIVESLRTNWRTSKYFDKIEQKSHKNIDFYYQLPIYFKDGIELKALLDLVIVAKDDEDNILWVQPIDLKTMSGNTINFITSLKSYRYDIQAAWYTWAIENHFKDIKEIRNFIFIVESTTNTGKPLVYQIENDILSLGKNGREEVKVNGITIARETKGYQMLLNEYLRYSEQGWKEDKRTEGKEIISLSWDGINK